MREIPKKNYVILFILVIAVVFITLAAATLYKNYSSNDKSYMSENITIVDSTTIQNYIKENSLVFIYVSDESINTNLEEEKKLLEKIEEFDLKKYFVFFNSDNDKNLAFIKNNYNIDYKDKNLILLIEDNMLIDKLVLEENYEQSFNKFINLNGVLND